MINDMIAKYKKVKNNDRSNCFGLAGYLSGVNVNDEYESNPKKITSKMKESKKPNIGDVVFFEGKKSKDSHLANIVSMNGDQIGSVITRNGNNQKPTVEPYTLTKEKYGLIDTIISYFTSKDK